MIGLNIWNKGQLRLFCILIGMVVGYVAAVATGLLTLDDFCRSCASRCWRCHRSRMSASHSMPR